jgi:hypothetical protein
VSKLEEITIRRLINKRSKEMLEKISTISKMILELKLLPQETKTKKTIQHLQQELDRVIYNSKDK